MNDKEGGVGEGERMRITHQTYDELFSRANNT